MVNINGQISNITVIAIGLNNPVKEQIVRISLEKFSYMLLHTCVCVLSQVESFKNREKIKTLTKLIKCRYTHIKQKETLRKDALLQIRRDIS